MVESSRKPKLGGEIRLGRPLEPVQCFSFQEQAKHLGRHVEARVLKVTFDVQSGVQEIYIIDDVVSARFSYLGGVLAGQATPASWNWYLEAGLLGLRLLRRI